MSFGIPGIQGRPLVELTDPTANKATETHKAPAQPNNTAARLDSRDTVKLTDKVAQMQALESQIADQPVVDTHRVMEVQRAMSTGTYSIEPSQVANKMLNFELGLDGGQ